MKNENAHLTLNAYLGRFAIDYLLAAMAFVMLSGLLLYLFEFQMPYPASFAILIAAAAPVSWAFVRDAGRAPARGERANFALLATLASVAISFVISIAVMMAIFAYVMGRPPRFDEIVIGLSETLYVRELGPMAVALILLVAAAVSWLVIYIFIGIFAKQALKQRR